MENFSRLSRALPSSAGRDRLKRPCHGGVDGFEMLWMGSEVTFVQFTSASRCVGELGLCGIALNGVRGTGQRTRDDATRQIKIGASHVVANWRVVTCEPWLFVRSLHQSETRSGSA